MRFLRFHKNNPKNSNIYLLCASAYTAADYSKFGLFKNKTYKWGYFPETKKYEDIEVLVKSKKKIQFFGQADLVKQSFLREYPVQVIHNGIDLPVFRPTLSNFRQRQHIPVDKFVLLGVAFGWRKNMKQEIKNRIKKTADNR